MRHASFFLMKPVRGWTNCEMIARVLLWLTHPRPRFQAMRKRSWTTLPAYGRVSRRSLVFASLHNTSGVQQSDSHSYRSLAGEALLDKEALHDKKEVPPRRHGRQHFLDGHRCDIGGLAMIKTEPFDAARY